MQAWFPAKRASDLPYEYDGLLTGTAHIDLAEKISQIIEHPLCQADVGRFPDGEVNIKLGEDVRGKIHNTIHVLR